MSSEENNKLRLKMKIIGLEKYKLVLGEIQRCSKRSVEISCLQMRTAGFDKCKAGKPANPDICSAQIHMHDFDKSMRARHTDGKCIYMLERSFIQIITHIAKMIRWCIGSAIPINDFIGHQYQKYDTG